MKEKISIKNFSIINDIEMEINKINILIGEQASGKSLISKLVFFFKRVVLEEMYKSIYDSKDFEDYVLTMVQSFRNVFPSYFYENKNFEIVFQYGIPDVRIAIFQKESKLGFDFGNPIVPRKFEEIAKSGNFKKDYFQSEKIQYDIRELFFGNQSNSYFIPATRSFFSVIQKNVFKLDLSDIGDEFFIKRFGIISEFVKDRVLNYSQGPRLNYEQILKAKYEYDGKEEWLVKGNKKVRLRDSSTGQQELVYLVLFLATMDFSKKESNFFVIEEPGAHIFPSSQKELVDLLATVYNKKSQRNEFLITTHSPYILTCFNNLLQAQNVFNAISEKRNRNEISKKDFDKLNTALNEIIPAEKRIDFEDLSVYLIENGGIKDIKDYENKLIDADPIDDVSEIISKEFSNLLDIKYGG